MLKPSRDNLRAEQARYGLTNLQVAAASGIRTNHLASYRSGKKKLTVGIAMRWSMAINLLVGAPVFLITAAEDNPQSGEEEKHPTPLSH